MTSYDRHYELISGKLSLAQYTLCFSVDANTQSLLGCTGYFTIASPHCQRRTLYAMMAPRSAPLLFWQQRAFHDADCPVCSYAEGLDAQVCQSYCSKAHCCRGMVGAAVAESSGCEYIDAGRSARQARWLTSARSCTARALGYPRAGGAAAMAP